ncbi:MAG: monovalent cation/H+ antiporter subunit D family protein [Candidatus Manganitrophaceae bacterium]|nr:MAG: monovalent cation/H+ antiporter subunit D family protein [Candidatus Manganitrophaceae bacterium]
MEIESIKPLLAVAISLLGAALIVATRKDPNIREGCSLLTAVLKFFIVLSMIPAVLAGNKLHYTLFSLFPGVTVEFRVDALGLLFATTASFLWILTTLYSIGYMRSLHEHAQTRYYTCFALTLSATLGVAFSANLVTMFIFYELITFVTYPLVTHHGTKEAYAAGNKYLFYLLATTKAFFVTAMFLTYNLSDTFAFKEGGVFPASAGPMVLTITYFLFLAGLSKAAIMPLHGWLPSAMVAPTPVSALLHAVAVVNTGVFCVLRVMFHIFGVDLMKALNLGVMTGFIVSFTIVMASIYALTKDNLKARLAYSTVSQLSYMILGGALLTSSGMAGGIMHIANHAFAKITLFFCAGSIYVASRKTNISELSGIGRKMPWTMTAFALATLSMIGVPPVSGFLTKWYLMTGSMEAKEVAFIFVLLFSSLLNAFYFLPIVHKAFFEGAPEGEEASHKGLHPVPQSLGAAAAKGHDHPHEGPIREPSYFLVVPLLLCAVISVVLGIYPEFLLDLIKLVVK